MDALEKAGTEHGFRGDDVDGVEVWELREQLVISRPEAIRVGHAIGHREDDARQRARTLPGVWFGRGGDDELTQAVLVARTCRSQPPLVSNERGGQKRCLLKQLFCATVGIPVLLELGAQVAVEVSDAAAEPPHEVVQVQHFRNETGPDLKRRSDPLVYKTAGDRSEDHFPLKSVEQTRRYGYTARRAPRTSRPACPSSAERLRVAAA